MNPVSREIQIYFYSVASVGDALAVTSVDKELQDIQRRTADFLRESIGARVENKVFEELEDTYVMWSSGLSLTGRKPFSLLLGLPSGMNVQFVTIFIDLPW